MQTSPPSPHNRFPQNPLINESIFDLEQPVFGLRPRRRGVIRLSSKHLPHSHTLLRLCASFSFILALLDALLALHLFSILLFVHLVCLGLSGKCICLSCAVYYTALLIAGCQCNCIVILFVGQYNFCLSFFFRPFWANIASLPIRWSGMWSVPIDNAAEKCSFLNSYSFTAKTMLRK